MRPPPPSDRPPPPPMPPPPPPPGAMQTGTPPVLPPPAPEAKQNGSTAAVGRVRGGGRPRMLRHMPGAAPRAEDVGFTSNHPRCPTCDAPARPAILMFGDFSW